jgi:hypothetical protein
MASPSSIRRVFAYFYQVRLGNSPEPEALDAAVDAWDMTFPDIRDEELLAAAVGYVQVGKFWPTPSEVRAFCPSLRRAALTLAADNAQTGRDIWPRLLRQVGSIGRNSRDWAALLAERLDLPEDRLVDAVDAAGGWLALCNASHDVERAGQGRRFAAAWSRASEEREAVKVLDFGAEARRRLEGKNGK